MVTVRVRKSRQLFAEHLLNNRLQMGLFHCDWGARNANKTNENRSVRTGQGELENLRGKLGAAPSEHPSVVIRQVVGFNAGLCDHKYSIPLAV